MKPTLRITFTLALLTLPMIATVQAQTEVALTDPNIHYIGRWDKSDPNEYHSYWSGAYLRTKFSGTSVQIDLAGGTTLAVCIDGEVPRTVSGVGLIHLNASPLRAGDHNLQVGSAGQNEEVLFKKLVLDAGAKTEPSPERPVIEYIGDSITMGNHSYSWDSAEMLGCDHVQIAFSARALTTGYGCATDKAGLDQQFFLLKNFNHLDEKPPVPWNFSYTPNVVVINLGQNDQCGQEPQDVFHKSFVDFVHKLREKYPQVPIAAMRPFGGPFANPIKSAVDELTAAGDAHIIYVDTTGWLDKDDYVDGVHPHFYGSFKAAHRLDIALEPLLKPSH